MALKAFGDSPFLAVTTRRISEAADVSLPTLQYYFGSKEGLYLACAEAIVERFRRHTTVAAAEAAEGLKQDCTAQTARGLLKSVIGALAGFLAGVQGGRALGPVCGTGVARPWPRRSRFCMRVFGVRASN